LPFLLVLAILFALVAAVLAVLYKKTDASKLESKILGWVVVVLGVGAALTLLAASFTQVGTKDVGIETAFGKTVGHLSNGPHLIAPWNQVHSMDAAVQTDVFTGGQCIAVRLANQQTGCADTTIRWRIQPGSSDELYQNYRTFDHVRDSLVTRELVAAVNNQFADYNPLNSIVDSVPTSNHPTNPPLSTIAKNTAVQMRAEIGGQINVLTVIVSYVQFDATTQKRLNQLQQQFALTRVAEQERITNEKQALANKALAASINTSPNVLVAQCLNTLEEMVKNGQGVPAGFSCWPGGSGTPVIANSTGSPVGGK